MADRPGYATEGWIPLTEQRRAGVMDEAAEDGRPHAVDPLDGRTEIRDEVVTLLLILLARLRKLPCFSHGVA